MKIFQLLLTGVAVLNVSFACWDCHPDCSGYDECVEENKDRDCRQLQAKETVFPATENVSQPAIPINMASASSLRGPALDGVNRELVSSSNFQIKMEWQSHYCWQEEKRERKWCWECRGSCSDGNRVEIEKCDSGDDKQRWVYRDESGGYVRISPKSNHGLCLERDGNSMRLNQCNSGEDKQLLKGFENNGYPFELVPKGKDDYVLSQEHDPKSEEEIELIKKSTARGDHTNYWQVYNAATIGSSSSNSNGDDDDDPRYDFKGTDYCSSTNKCGRCEGDCDEDDDCEGYLVCHERSGNEKINGCSGGSEDNSDSDYCAPP